MVGAIMRLSTSTGQEPTSMIGGLGNLDNPFNHQRLIIAAPTSTTLTLNASVDTLTSVKYTISDPIDIEPGAMLLAFQRLCDAEYAMQLNVEKWAERRAIADRDLRLAMENDRRTTYARQSQPMFDRFRRVTVTTE
jgi:hypothetical protein